VIPSKSRERNVTELLNYYDRMGLNIETYDSRSAAWADSVGGDVAFYRARAKETGGPVLEIASGTGRVAWPLAEAGFEVTGLDLSEAMIEAASAKAGSRDEVVRQRIRFVQGDMRSFELNERFPIVIIPFRAFLNLLTPGDQEACLESIHVHLKPGGILVVDVFDPRLDLLVADADAPRECEDAVNPVTGRLVEIRVARRESDPFRQTFFEDWRFTEVTDEGEILREEVERLELRWIYRYEAKYLFERCGFAVEAEYSDFRGAPPAYGKEQVWVLRKA
jgi:SAM-dependent methyltransferase